VPTLTLDIFEDTLYREIDGVPQEAMRIAVVSGSTETTHAIIPQDALDFLDAQADASIIPGGAHPAHEALILRDREVRALGASQVRVALMYRLFTTAPPPVGSPSVISGGVSLEQVTTWFDRTGDDIFVSSPQGEIEYVEADVLEPRAELHFEKALQSMFPGELTVQYAGTTNSARWNAANPGTWLCTDATFESLNLNITPPWWTFRFSFRHLLNGWDPIVVYLDPNNNRRMPGTTFANGGVKRIVWYYRQDFNNLDLI